MDGAGTIEYMAPELLNVKPMATVASDIYAFGVILYQMLTGRVPFPQSGPTHRALAECLNAIMHSPPPRFSEVAPDRRCRATVEDLVLQCLAKDPAQRPQTMVEVRDRFLANYPPLQETPKLKARRQGIPSRSWRIVAGGAAMLLLLSLFIILANINGTKTKIEVPATPRSRSPNLKSQI